MYFVVKLCSNKTPGSGRKQGGDELGFHQMQEITRLKDIISA